MFDIKSDRAHNISHDITGIIMRTTPDQYFAAVRSYIEDHASDTYMVFGPEVGSLLPAIISSLGTDGEPPVELLKTPAWSEFSDLYSYAVEGLEPPNGSPVRGDFYDILCLPGSLQKLPPNLFKVYFLAQARHVFDGGSREYEDEPVPDGFLTVREVAALADMDERSVRNAMNPKSPDRLTGQPHANRTFIPVAEARRWLKGRRGFQPTKKADGEDHEALMSISLPRDLATQILSASAKEGVSVPELLARCLTVRAEHT
jgi:hypothetical protein